MDEADDCKSAITECVYHFKSELTPIVKSKTNFATTNTGLDILLSNAAIVHDGPIEAITAEIFDMVYSVNLRAPALLTAAAAPHIKEARGCILYTSSVAGW